MIVEITFPASLESAVRAFHPTVALNGESVQDFYEEKPEYSFNTSQLDAAGIEAYQSEFGDAVGFKTIE